MKIHLDLSQLIMDPRRSGIQRAERELIRHWPGPLPLVPCYYDATTGTMQEISPDIFDVLCADSPAGGVAEERSMLEPLAKPIRTAMPQRLLNAELFNDADRADFYRLRPEYCRAFWLVYDFLPWLHPDWFNPGSAVHLMPYLDALRSISDVAFISEHTRDDFSNRILRRPFHGPVIPMGADGLGLEQQEFSDSRRTFVMLGSIEPRKNSLPVMEAFKQLWADGLDADLVMIGAVAPDAPQEIAMLSSLQGQPHFKHLRNASDQSVREVMRTARALVFPSEGEGYGIPPMEALHAGIPVIVSSDLPSIAGQPSMGQLRLDKVLPNTIAEALVRLLDQQTGRALWDEAAKMPSFTWGDFAREVGRWVQS